MRTRIGHMTPVMEQREQEKLRVAISRWHSPTSLAV